MWTRARIHNGHGLPRMQEPLSRFGWRLLIFSIERSGKVEFANRDRFLFGVGRTIHEGVA